MKKIITVMILTTLLAGAHRLAAQQVEAVQDLAPTIQQSSGSSFYAPVTVGNLVYFVSDDGIHGQELWKTDGTAAGTVMVKDVYKGSPNGNISYMIDVNGVLFFVADDGNGPKLWKSNGTETGTVMVGSGYSDLTQPTNFNGTLFFKAYNSASGYELWKSDGTDAGTVLAVDIVPGPGSGDPSAITSVNGSLYFSANNGTDGYEPWKSDGTIAGTSMLANLNLSSGSDPVWFTNANGLVFFTAVDSNNGMRRVYKTNGASTSAVSGYYTSYNLGNFINVNGTLYFSGDDNSGAGLELWKTDGTSTAMVQDIWQGPNGSGPANLTNFNSALYFIAYDGTISRLFKTDVTGTVTLTNSSTEPVASNSTVKAVNNVLYFAVGGALWKTDGTVNGTVFVKGIDNGYYPEWFASCNGSLLFSGGDPIHGNEPWKSDGTAAGTSMLKDINTYPSNLPSNLININGTFFFTMYTPDTGTELWKTDGSSNGAVMVQDVNPGVNDSQISRMVSVNGVLYFSAYHDVNGWGLWKSDGTGLGTKPVKVGLAEALSWLTNVNGTLFFRANDGSNGSELWKSDGTANGTSMVKDIVTGGGSSGPSYLINVNGTLYFQAYSPDYGVELWKSDGTIAGTEPIDINPGTASSFAYNFANVNGTLFFAARGPVPGGGGIYRSLWKTDGATTVVVKHILPNNDDSFGTALKAINGILYFGAQPSLSTSWTEVWKSDGTEVGTVPITSFSSSGGGYPNDDLTDVNGTLYFSATVIGTGRVLHKYDGVTTKKVTKTGANISSPYSMVVVNGELFFSNWYTDPKLWKTDGTEAGTVDMNALSIEDLSSSTVLNDKALYYFGLDGKFYRVRAKQTIQFSQLSTKTIGDAAFTLSATSDSGLLVSYTSSDPSVATVSGNTVTIVGAGTTNIMADQTGDLTYAPATQATQQLVVNKGTQTITFAALANKTYGDLAFTLSATSDSGLPVTYSVVSGPAMINANSVIIMGAGAVSIKASQGGNDNYSAAADVIQSFNVAKASQTITFGALGFTEKFDSSDDFTLSAVATSGLPVTFAITGAATLVNDNTVHLELKNIGAVTITATQTGNENYAAASSVVQTFEVKRDMVAAIEPIFERVKVYPNPVSTTLIVESSEKIVALQMTDVNGKVHADIRLNGETRYEMNVSGIPEGLMMTQVQTTNGVAYYKIIINR